MNRDFQKLDEMQKVFLEWREPYIPVSFAAFLYPCQRGYIYRLIAEGKVAKDSRHGFLFVGLGSLIVHRNNARLRK